MINPTNLIQYRVVSREVIEEHLSEEDAHYLLANLEAQGQTNLIIEDYVPKSLGRDTDLHLSK